MYEVAPAKEDGFGLLPKQVSVRWYDSVGNIAGSDV